MSCIFCGISEGKIKTELLYEDSEILAFRDIHPKARIHLLVIPRLHIESLFELKEEHSALAGHLLLSLPTIAKANGLEAGFRSVINTGAGGGQEIYHLHFHLLAGT